MAVSLAIYAFREVAQRCKSSTSRPTWTRKCYVTVTTSHLSRTVAPLCMVQTVYSLSCRRPSCKVFLHLWRHSQCQSLLHPPVPQGGCDLLLATPMAPHEATAASGETVRCSLHICLSSALLLLGSTSSFSLFAYALQAKRLSISANR